jgi:hypothetical protein
MDTESDWLEWFDQSDWFGCVLFRQRVYSVDCKQLQNQPDRLKIFIVLLETARMFFDCHHHRERSIIVMQFFFCSLFRLLNSSSKSYELSK